jgi:hypothetical protein
MDIREGLTRISLVLWALVGLGGALFAGAVLVSGRAHSEDVAAGLLFVVLAVVGHLVCRWIIRGFFPARA